MMSESVKIIKDASTIRKLFRLMVFVLCLVGFVCQFYYFLMFYLTYPTSLEIFIKHAHVEDIPKPVVTVCDHNILRRRDYCKDFPSVCERPKNIKKFCIKYPYPCLFHLHDPLTDVLIPDESAIILSSFNRSLVEKYGMKVDDILMLYRNNTSELILTNENNELVKCYSLDLENFVQRRFKQKFYDSVKILGSYKVADVLINFNLVDLVYPYRPGIKMAVHSKDKLINPFIDGFLVIPGRKYIVQLKPIKNILLKHPFNTNCTDYNVRKDSPFNETYNQDRCVIECKKLNWLKHCGCVSTEYPFHYKGKFCYGDDRNCVLNVSNVECYYNCGTSCRFYNFDYEISDYSNDHIIYDIPNELLSDPYFSRKKTSAEVSFILKRPELLIREYKPRLQLIEIFSFAGGYSGIWLGISLFSIMDYLEWLIIYVYTKKQEKILNSKSQINVLTIRDKIRY